jgi:tRNA(Ile)-lysidine synthase
VIEDLKQRVLHFIREGGLVQSGETLLVGVSGGADSVCLLHVLNQLKGTLEVELHVAHLNHTLRGTDSDDDANYVSELASHLNVSATVERVDVEAYGQGRRLSVEEAAREVRYTFFAKLARDIGADRVALGHTRDDQIETILMNLLRGTGLTGLRGMLPSTELYMADNQMLKVIRPLLDVTRKDVEKYCSELDLDPRVDLSNLSLEHTRNRIRHKLIPALRIYNRNVDMALIRTAEAAVDAIELLDREVSEVWEQVITNQPNGLLIDSGALLSCHPSIQRHLLRRAVLNVLGDLVDVQAVHIDKMIEALSKPAGRRIVLPRGIYLSVGYRTCLLSNGTLDSCPLPSMEGQHRLMVPGDILIPGWRVRTSIGSHSAEQGRGFEACLDLAAAGKDLVLRTRRPGDRFQPLGMKGTKSLQDFMVDAKIPQSWRGRVPLVCSPEAIVWVAGWRISEGVKVTNETKRVLRIEFERV